MADGSFKRIVDVKKGDYVNTGFSGDQGLVTEVLSHDVSKNVKVGVLPTPFGDLVGTPDHPIYFNNEWVEFSEMLNYKAREDEDLGNYPFELKGSLQRQYVHVFYNLEIDGDDEPGLSSHSYVVNGIIASGLGDNHVLNSMFARQKFWKASE